MLKNNITTCALQCAAAQGNNTLQVHSTSCGLIEVSSRRFSHNIPNDAVTYQTFIWNPVTNVQTPVNMTSSASCGGAAWLPNGKLLFKQTVR